MVSHFYAFARVVIEVKSGIVSPAPRPIFFAQTFPNPKRISPQVQNGINVDYVVFHLIIYAEWKSPRQHPMELKVDRMNSWEENQRVKIGKD